MNSLKSIVMLALLMGLHASCATSYRISSFPEGAQVYSNDKLLGDTPLKVSSADIDVKTSGGTLLRVEKDNYKRLWIWIPVSGKDYQIDLNMAFLHPTRSDTNTAQMSMLDKKRSGISVIADKLLTMQGDLLLAKPVEQEKLDALKKDNPNFGSIYFLDSVQKILNKDNDSAALALKDAVKYSPEESDFESLKNEIEIATEEP